jgi:hypothetical protein
MPHNDFAVIYNGNIVHADLLKCLLEGEGIAARLEDEFLGRTVPYAASARGAGAVKVLVANAADVEKANRVVGDFVKDSTT